jgi:putative glutamine amidotransferase
MLSQRYSFIGALFLSLALLAAFPAEARPVIGISGTTADSVRAMMTEVTASGGTPLFLSNYAGRDPDADIEKIDALVVMGNAADIDPARYGEKPHSKTVNEMDTPKGKARAAYEYAIMQKAIKIGMPLLGICGGEQRLNVLRGGTLHQHVPDLIGNDQHAQHHYNIAPFVPVVPVSIAPGTELAQIADTVDSLYIPGREADRTLMENSMHHQAIDHVGSGLRASAYSDEYIENGAKHRLIEAVEADPEGPFKDQFVLGVQWHPEFGASPLGPQIARRVVKEAETFAQKHERQHPAEEARKETIFSVLPDIQSAPGGLPPADTVTGDILKQHTQSESAAQ